ncbi:MAG: xylan 1,4-beta-xylosidase [Fusobacteriaceae bacterium]|jgi:xylan 1,4-beta-xylosidase|nr:xynB [Fusobacteriales bacterium]MDN5304836.1 xylan 1,4-beta-xylosidase [Fusobacteriaceae bacterium]
MAIVKNPILRGFNPDPSICRAGDDFYIAVSTFEWFPGVLIYHSKDLVNWKLVAKPLNRVSQLDMRGNPSSGGIWAPCLSYDNGVFYLIYTDVKEWRGFNSWTPFKDAHNYLVTTTDITGDWSEPIYLNSSGFDPSLFHDDDRKWFVNMKWNYRVGANPFDGILLQEYDPEQKKLVGPIKNIFKGTDIGVTEGPHLYKRNGYYYLLTAEGGTSYKHSVTLARAKNIDGPYEVHPENPILTSWNNPKLPIQKAGHASICEGKDGYWYMVHLGGRPLNKGKGFEKLLQIGKDLDGEEIRGVCPLGRETSIQRFEWKEDNWLYHVSGKNEPELEIEFKGIEKLEEIKEFYDNFEDEKLAIYFQSLRIPAENFATLNERKGYLRLYGQESLTSKFNQSVIARRQQSFKYIAETAVEFYPEDLQQMAGLLVKYNEDNQYYLRVTYDEIKNIRTLGILKFDDGFFEMPFGNDEIEVPNDVKLIHLKVEVNEEKLYFSYSFNGIDFIKIDIEFDSTILSDEYAWPMGFTGAFVGMACQDMSGRRKYADFKYFKYVELD